MRSNLPVLVFAGLLTTQATAQAPAAHAPAAKTSADAVSVRFTKPETFTDATYDNWPSSRQQVTREIAAYLAELGRRHLPPDQKLEIEITDIDLAGRYEPWQFRFQDVRFMRDVTWPRVNLIYRLTDDSGALLAEGEDKLSDMDYLSHGVLRPNSGRLRYEKAMLEEWFRERFAEEPL